MSSKPAPSPEILRSHEAAFIEHYSWLIRWALQLANNDRARAEDLVQELFAQLAFRHTNLSTVENIPAYLYTTLRNIHVSEIRIAGRSHIQSPSIVEYNLAATALSASNPQDLYQIKDQLRRICYYACVRKQSSRAGSIMILRFFFGYHLSEVAQVLGGTCEAVRQCLRFARNEARAFLDDPDSLSFIDRTTVKTFSPTTACGADEFLADLRLAIFSSREGECLNAESFEALYQNSLVVSANTSTLGHVVSCRRCLDTANRVLNLPLLAERHPADALGPDNSSRGGPRPSGGSGGTNRPVLLRRRSRKTEAEISGSFLLRCRRRARELFEHHPRELCVSVNGHVLGSQSVNSEISKLRLDITIPEPLSFIEVLSEENARLLVMPVDTPPNGEPTQALEVALSEGRRLEVTLRHGHPWPMLEVVYENPNFTSESQLSGSNIGELSKWNAPKPSSNLLVEAEPGFKPPTVRLANFGLKNISRCWRLLVSLLTQNARLKLTEKKPEVAGLFSLSDGAGQQRFRLGIITAILSVLLIGALLFIRLNITPTVSAANLIKRASALEETFDGSTDRAVHRVVNLEERAHPGGEMITRRRIEIWRDAGNDRSVRRVYDDEGKLIAGEWLSNHSKSKGIASRTIYQRGNVSRMVPTARNPLAAIRNLELWQLEPSAKEFAEIIGNIDAASVREDPYVYVLSFAGAQPATVGVPLQATLILRKSDLRPVEQVLHVPSITGTREYRFVEAAFERPSVRDVTPAIFEPDAELVSQRVGRADAKLNPDRNPSDGPALSGHSPVRATADLEVEAAYVLDKFRARFGDQVNLVRTPQGSLEITGIVDSAESRKEILNALSHVIDHPALTVQIQTVAEVLAQQPERSPDRVISREFSGSQNSIPVFAELHSFFSRHGRADAQTVGGAPSDDQVDQAVRSFAARVVERSRTALSHAIELRQLKKRFSSSELNILTPDARVKYLGLIRSHAEALRRETSQLRGELAPIFFASGGAAPDLGSIATDADITIAIEHAYQTSIAIDEGIRSSLSASSRPAAGTLLKSPRFLDSLIEVEKLARRIRQMAEGQVVEQ